MDAPMTERTTIRLSDLKSGEPVDFKVEPDAEARAWAESDPYVEAGVYESVEVSPFIRVFPS